MTLDEFRALVKASSPAPWGNWIVRTSPQEIPTGEVLPLVHGAGPPHVVHEMTEIDDIGKACRDMDLIAAMRGRIDLFLELWEAAEQVKRNFMAIDDGFYTGLVPPEFAPLLPVLAKLQGEKA